MTNLRQSPKRGSRWTLFDGHRPLTAGAWGLSEIGVQEWGMRDKVVWSLGVVQFRATNAQKSGKEIGFAGFFSGFGGVCKVEN